MFGNGGSLKLCRRSLGMVIRFTSYIQPVDYMAQWVLLGLGYGRSAEGLSWSLKSFNNIDITIQGSCG